MTSFLTAILAALFVSAASPGGAQTLAGLAIDSCRPAAQ